MTEVTDSSADQESDVDALLHNVEFGLPLKEAREKADLSLMEVAQSLLISEEIVGAIENSQIEKLPSATFVIGYIRSYARMLNIAADDIIEAYNKSMPNNNQAPVISFLPAEKKDTGNKTAIVMVVLIVLLLTLAWWFQLDKSTDLDKSYIQNEVTDIVDQVDVIHENDLISIGTEDLYADSNTNLEQDVSDVAQLTDAAALNEVNELPVAALDKLVLSANGESWCEVFDATGKRLFYQLIKQGEKETIYGQAPFKVFLGNASKIIIETNNKIVNFSHLIAANKNVVNFVVSANSEVTASTR